MDDAAQPTVSLAELLARHLRVNMLAKPTEARYDLVTRNLARFLCGPTAHACDVYLNQITPDVMLDFRAWSLTRMKPVSFNTERRHLSVLFNCAVREGLMPANPLRRVSNAPVSRGAPKALTKDSMNAYLEWLQTATRRDRNGRAVDVIQPQWFWYTVLRTFYFTGMRKRQLIGLVWSDIDFVERSIHLSAESSKTRRGWKVPLPEPLVNDLLDLRRRTLEVCREHLGPRQVFCLPLFSERRSVFRYDVMRPDNLDNFFQRLRKAMPVDTPRLSAHKIRHTTSTILANKVPNLKVVQEQLGHTSINTTYIYVHPNLATMRDALQALE